MAPRNRRAHIACRVEDLSVGEKVIVNLDGRSVGVFNVAGELYALHNRCPHTGGALCEGPICGTTLPTDDFKFIKTGQALVDPKVRAKTFPVTVENGDIVVHI